MKSDIQSLKLRWSFEIIAILITFIIVGLIVAPIVLNINEYVFLIFNMAAIFLFFTLIRYVFLLRLTPFARFSPIKLIFIFLAIPIFVYLVDGLAEFQFFLDENGTYALVKNLHHDKQIPLSKYIRAEMIFFTVGSIIATAILPIRMIISLWRVRNRNTI